MMRLSAMRILMGLLVTWAAASGAPRGDHLDSMSAVSRRNSPPKASTLKIGRVEPTVLFRRAPAGLAQAVDIRIENPGSAADAELKVRFHGLDELSVKLGLIETGTQTCRVFVPEVAGTPPVEFVLITSGKEHDRFSMNWTPRKQWEICMIPIAHHDLGYTAPIEHVMANYRDIFKDVIRFCEETEDYPDEAKFRYSVEQSWSLQHFIEGCDQATREKLAKYIGEGRIEVPALYGNLVTGMCGHEELIRMLYPSFRINKELGGRIQVGSIVDMPGLGWGLPTILSGAGIRYLFAGLAMYFEGRRERYGDIRTFWDEKSIVRPHGRPDAFYWKGPDGSKVLVYYQGGYGCWSPQSYDQILNQLPGMLDAMDAKGSPFSVMRYAGYTCDDNTKPDVIVSRLVKEWNSLWAYPKLIVATNGMFFEKLERQSQDLRTFTGDIPDTDYPVGALSMAKETAMARILHDRLPSAEKLATMAHLLLGSKRYPAKDIREAYNQMMLHDEHTFGMWMIGDVANWATDEKSRFAYRATGLTELVLSGFANMYDRSPYAGGARDIAYSIAFNQEGPHVVVFNPLSMSRNDLVTVPSFFLDRPFELIDSDTGRKATHQITIVESPLAPVPHAAARYAKGESNPPVAVTLSFVAENVPALGYKSYRIVPAPGASVPIPFLRGHRIEEEEISHLRQRHATSLVVTDHSLENRFFKVVLNPVTGTVLSIRDKELDLELVDPQAPHQVNQLVTRRVTTGKEESPQTATIRKGQSGPVHASLVVSTSGAGCPQLTQEIILYDRIKRIDFNNRVLKDSTSTMEVYFAFPFKMDNPDFRFEGPLSVIKPLRDQLPGSNSNYYSVQHWANVSDGRVGITLAPIESHLFMFGGLNSIEVSPSHHLAKPVNFGGPFVKELTRGHMYSHVINNNFGQNFAPVQMGDLLFRYSVTSHKGNWIDGRPRDFGWAAGNPLIPVLVPGDDDRLRLCCDTVGNPLVPGRPAEGRVPFVLKNRDRRLPESASLCQVDQPNVILMTLKKAEDEAGVIFRLHETEGRDTDVGVTFPGLGIRKAYETNLVETNQKPLEVRDRTIKVRVEAFGVKTIRLLVEGAGPVASAPGE